MEIECICGWKGPAAVYLNGKMMPIEHSCKSQMAEQIRLLEMRLEVLERTVQASDKGDD